MLDHMASGIAIDFVLFIHSFYLRSFRLPVTNCSVHENFMTKDALRAFLKNNHKGTKRNAAAAEKAAAARKARSEKAAKIGWNIMAAKKSRIKMPSSAPFGATEFVSHAWAHCSWTLLVALETS